MGASDVVRGAYVPTLAKITVDLYHNKWIKRGAVLLVVGVLLFSLYEQGMIIRRHTATTAYPRRNKTQTKSHVPTQLSKNDVAFINTTLMTRVSKKSPVTTKKTRVKSKSSASAKTSYPAIDLEKYVPPLKEIFNRTVIITAASSNHVKELIQMVATVQMHMPDTKVIVYDLGVTKEQRKMILRMCNIMEVRDVDYSKYPLHVKDLMNYAWKPAIIKETLYEFGAIFWADTSIRFKQSIFPLYRFLKDFHGYIPTVTSYATTNYKFSNYKTTHPDMYRYLGVDLENTYKNDTGYTPKVQGGRILFVNGSFMNEKLLQPWVDCAMVKRCIAPEGSQNPHLKRVRGYYIHRYDQSALGVLMYKNLRGLFQKGHDASEVFNSVSVVRNDNGYFKNANKITYCD